MKTLKDFENKLLKRRELQLAVEASSNPGFKIAEKIAENFKSAPELVVVKNVKSGFGKSEFIVDAFIYKDADAKKIEPKPKVKKDANGGAK